MAGLVGFVKDIGECILTQFILTEYIQPPIKRHIDYWRCFEDNIEGHRKEVQELERQIYDLKQKIEDAGLRRQVVRPAVEEWLEASTPKLEEARSILLPDDNIPKAWNIASRYKMGKRAKKTAEEIAKVRNDGNFNTVADPPPPPAMGSPYHRPTMEFESRKSIEKDIVDCLKEESTVGMIVIWGMGGVGKTAMAKRIRERVKAEDKFAEVVMVTVSQTINDQQIQKIRSEIAEWLKLEFHEMNETIRAAKLHERLMMDKKRKIIILDDVWDSFKSKHLEDLGIPVESKMCKVVLTSRCADACKGIKNKNVFKLNILEEDEAWLLFKDKAGDCGEGVEDSRLLNCVAKEVAAECKGLPLALVTVGLALQNITNIYTWDNALSQLRKANPEDFSDVSRDVYNPLKLSYDFLEDDKERDLFLLCCLFPEDFNISVEQLTWYSMGLELFLGVDNIKEARERTHTLVGRLESRSLLIHVEKEGKKGLEVKMHDVIRDVAIYIGSIEKRGFLKSLHRSSKENSSDVNCNWMSVDISNEQMEVPVLSRFPKLRLLMLSSNNFYDISRISFDGMEDLNVLSFERISIPSLPPTLGSLENLQTLRLFHCKVQDISVIGKLTSLKILSCYHCSNITELPAEIGILKGLRLLELNGCSSLQRIPFGIISSLTLLEELKIGRRSFSEWETGGERRNASLTELEHLRNLTCLEIEISDCTSSAQEIRLSQKLVGYRIRIGKDRYGIVKKCSRKLVRYRIPIGKYRYLVSEEREYEKVMKLKLPGAVGNWIQLLARNADCLSLEGDGSDNINLAEMENLRNLNFTNCSTVKKLVATTRLLQLEFLHIEGCDSMEQVFWNEGTDDNTDGYIEFSKLKLLTLLKLPNLTVFCRGLENIIIKFSNLIELKIGQLPKLNSLLFCNPKDVSFCNLKSINISECYNLSSLFSVSASGRCLSQLEVLMIEDCESMKKVFWNEDTDDNTDGCIEFPKLKELSLHNLPNLTAFCQGLENIIIKFPKLTKMEIQDLPNLNSLLFCNPKGLLQLEDLEIRSCESMEEVFRNEGTDNNTCGCIEFPKLNSLRLYNLPNLTAFCQGLENIIIKFPNLTQMWIIGLPKLNSLFPLNSETLENTCFHLFCSPTISLLGVDG